MRRTPLMALLASTLLHAAVVVPRWVAREGSPTAEPSDTEQELDLSDEQDDADGELPIEPLLDAPFQVTLYVEPAPPVPPAAPEASAAAEPAAVVALPLPPPLALPVPAEEVVAAVAPEPEPAPEPPPVEEPPPEPPLSEADREALAAMERGEATADADAPEEDADEIEALSPKERHKQARAMRRARNREQKARGEPCPEPTESIARVAETAWYIDRDLIEYYATHMIELQKLGYVWTHRDVAGDADGFRVRLARCSVLKQGGLRSGDIVHDINGRRISTVLQAIGAYFALRAEPELAVRITRRGEPVVLAYTIEQPQSRREKRRAARKAAASQAAR